MRFGRGLVFCCRSWYECMYVHSICCLHICQLKRETTQKRVCLQSKKYLMLECNKMYRRTMYVIMIIVGWLSWLVYMRLRVNRMRLDVRWYKRKHTHIYYTYINASVCLCELWCKESYVVPATVCVVRGLGGEPSSSSSRCGNGAIRCGQPAHWCTPQRLHIE